MIWGLFFGQNHRFDPFWTYLPPPMIYIVGKLWISASIWQRAIEILSTLQAVRILMTRWNRNEWLISDPVISGFKAHIYDVVDDNGSFVFPLSVICLLFSRRPELDQSSPWKLNRICTFNPIFLGNLTVCCFLHYHPTSSPNEICDPCLLVVACSCGLLYATTTA